MCSQNIHYARKLLCEESLLHEFFLFCLQVSGWTTDLLQIYTEQTYWVPWGSLWTSPKNLHEWIVFLSTLEEKS